MQNNPTYTDVIEDIKKYFTTTINIANSAGIDKRNIIIDPGIGFGKTASQNLIILKNLNKLKHLQCPILVGTSKKSFIGKILKSEIDNRLYGTIATNAIAIWNGASIIRVHDVTELKEISTMVDSIKFCKE